MSLVWVNLLRSPDHFYVGLQGPVCLAQLRASLARHIFNRYLYKSAVDQGG